MRRREFLLGPALALACGGEDGDVEMIDGRRLGERGGRHGRSVSSLPGAVPRTYLLVSSVTPVLSIHADASLVLDDDTLGVTAWQDRTGNGNHYSNLGADSTLPLWSQSGGPGGRGMVSGDGSARFIRNIVWDPTVPGTTPMYWRMIARLNTWTDGAHLWGGVTAYRLALVCTTTTPSITIRNTTVGPLTAMTLATWFRIEAYYSNSTSDLIKVGATSNTGTIVGNNDQSSHALFGITSGTFLCHCDIAKLEIFTGGLPTADERAAMDASDTTYYGGTVSM